MTPWAFGTMLLLVLSWAGCRAGSDVSEETMPDGSFVVSGRMEFVNIETGCWVLVADDGRRFEPSGEKAKPLWKNDLRVVVRVRELNNVASVCQTGVIITVEDIIESLEQ